MNEMKKYSEEVTYKNIEGYTVDFERCYESLRAHIYLTNTDDSVDCYTQKMSFSLSEAYKVMNILREVLRTHDPDYELKMMSSLEGKETIS